MAAMRGSILTLNAGSSSVKFALYDSAAGTTDPATARGEIENLDAEPHFLAYDASRKTLAEQRWPKGDGSSFGKVLDALLQFADTHLGIGGLAAVGHRIVHGGAEHTEPGLITPDLLEKLTALIPLDPLHLPLNIKPIRAMAAARPDLKQVACFDTAFHHTLPPVARQFALPREITDSGVRRYGFHGLSFEYIAKCLAERSPALARGRVIVAHLGSGASLCALANGNSVATTMGFSALDGLMMATRCGAIDPGILLYLGRQGHDFDSLEDMLYRHSGLLGVSGISGDVRVLLESGDPHAAEAIELFTYRMACESAALASALGGLDGIVFTAGIGEHSPAIRSAVCARLAWLGVVLDPESNAAHGAANSGRISTSDSRIAVLVIATDEEAMIARHTRTVLARQDRRGD